jgi:membrane-bound metal-dependent hydrolase YbcI (DUF457 family)
MLLFGHAGITLGAAALLAGAANKNHASQVKKLSPFIWLGKHVDIRLLLVGSLLPDIIDKPVGQFFFQETFSNGRIFSHTLLFLILVTVAGYFVYRYRRKLWLLVLAFGIFMHLLLDRMWLAPRTLFWPFLGLAFDRVDLENWLSDILRALLSRPGVYIPEAIGLLVLLYFGLVLIRHRKVGAFIRYGRVD